VGLRKSLAPGDGTVQDARDELFFLLIGAPLEDRRAHQRVAKEVGAHGRVGPGELFVQDNLLHERESLAAVRDGPASADPPTREELLSPGLVEAQALFATHRKARF